MAIRGHLAARKRQNTPPLHRRAQRDPVLPFGPSHQPPIRSKTGRSIPVAKWGQRRAAIVSDSSGVLRSEPMQGRSGDSFPVSRQCSAPFLSTRGSSDHHSQGASTTQVPQNPQPRARSHNKQENHTAFPAVIGDRGHAWVDGGIFRGTLKEGHLYLQGPLHPVSTSLPGQKLEALPSQTAGRPTTKAELQSL